MAELFIFSDAINKYINKQMIILLEREAWNSRKGRWAGKQMVSCF
jgi:hypothetical protein